MKKKCFRETAQAYYAVVKEADGIGLLTMFCVIIH